MPLDIAAARASLVALRAGQLLLANGAGAAEVVARVTTITRALGLPNCSVDVTSTSLVLSYRVTPDSTPVTEVRIVGGLGLDYTRVRAVYDLVDDVRAERVDSDEALARLDWIESAPPRYPAWAVTLTWGGLAGFFTVMLGGGPIVFAAAFVVTVVVDLINRVLAARGIARFYQCVVGGFVATAVATALHLTGATSQASLIVAGGIAVLLPGLSFVAGVQDAIAGFSVTAAARAMDAAVVTSAIVAGVGAVLYIAVRFELDVPLLPTGSLTLNGWSHLGVEALAAALVCCCFALCTQAPPRGILTAGLAGSLGWTIFLLLWPQAGLPPTVAAAIAAVLIGFGSHALASTSRNVPALLHVVAGIVPLAPGYTIYHGLLYLSQGALVPGVLAIGQAATIGLAIAAGASLGQALAGKSSRPEPLTAV